MDRKRRMMSAQSTSVTQQLMDGAPFVAQLTKTLALQRGTGSPNFTRATAATVMGYGPTANSGDSQVLLSCASGEARFQGARRISQDVWSDTFADGTPIPLSALKGYLAEGARTNYALWNRDLTNVVWVKTSCTAALTATGADNAANSASTLTATAGNATCLQSITRVSAQRVTGCKIKRRTGTGTINMTQDNGVTWTPVTVTSAYTNVAIPAATAANPIIGFQIVTNGDAIDVDFVMHEEAAFVSSSIATTTIAVARNADVLTYSGADVPNLKTLCATFKRESGVSGVGVIAVLTAGTDANTAAAYLSSETASAFAGVVASVTQWSQATSNAYTPGTTSKMAWSQATNDIKMAKDGTAQTQDTVATVPSSTALQVGHQNGAFQLSGNVGGIYGWTRNLSQSELNAITA